MSHLIQVGAGSGGMPVLDMLGRDPRVTRVTLIEPERTLVLGQGWTFALRPIDAATTRLIVRYPLRPDEFLNPAFTYAVFEPAHFVMESGMLLGIKRRAERDPRLSGDAQSGEEAP